MLCVIERKTQQSARSCPNNKVLFLFGLLQNATNKLNGPACGCQHPKGPKHTHPIFFSRCLFKRRPFFTFQTWAVLETSGRVELRGNWCFFYGPTPSIFMPMVFSIIPPNGERKINGKKERKKTRNIFPSSKAFDWKHIFLDFFFCFASNHLLKRHKCFFEVFVETQAFLLSNDIQKKASETRILHQKGTVFSFRPPFSGYRTASMAAFLDQPGVRYMGSNPHLNTCTPGQSAAATGLIKWIKLSQAELNMFYPLVEAKAPHPACAWF